MILTGWAAAWSAPCSMDWGQGWMCLPSSLALLSPPVSLHTDEKGKNFSYGLSRGTIFVENILTNIIYTYWYLTRTMINPLRDTCLLNLPISIHSGGTILHFCLCFRLRACHTGTSTGSPGLKGPRPPWRQKSTSESYLAECKQTYSISNVS